ncbi:MAG TPA: hypothetical protein VF062_02175 [Candidatus Limnocylindrales bacterium]
MRYLQHTCTHCHQVERIESALALVCPTCGAAGGSPCRDQRGSRYRELSSSHQARRDLVETTSVSVRRQLATAS